MRCALSIAGSDSIGGAGIQADIKAMAAVGVHAHTVITAITAQNTCAVKSIMPVPSETIKEQFETIISDSDVHAVKTGMLYNGEIAKTVAELLEDQRIPYVADPVLLAGVGDTLSSNDLVKALKKEIIPLCDILTPNKYEAEMLTGLKINNEYDARTACELLGKEGTTIYLKGGHIGSRNVVDTLYNGAEFQRFEYPRLETAGHGGGCILSSYITAHIAKGHDAIDSIIRSREMIQEAIADMYAIGKGTKVVNPTVKPDDSKPVLTSLERAIDRLVTMLPKELADQTVELGYAKEYSKGITGIATINGTVSKGVLKKSGKANFGITTNVAKMIVLATECDEKQRSAISMESNDDLVSTLEEIGMTGIKIKESGDLYSAIYSELKKNKTVPDAIFYKKGKKNGVFLLGKNPNDVVEKICSIL